MRDCQDSALLRWSRDAAQRELDAAALIDAKWHEVFKTFRHQYDARYSVRFSVRLNESIAQLKRKVCQFRRYRGGGL